MIVCNTRALNTPITGVQRYLQEILKRFPNDQFRQAAPPTWVQRPFNLLWEQSILPLRLHRNAMLWCPSNTGPLLVKRQVITVHDLATVEYPQDFSRLYRRYYDFLFPRLLPRVSGIITVSEYTRQRVLETYPGVLPENVHSIPLGVDHNRFKPQSAEAIASLRFKLDLPKRYVLYLGTLSARKNIGQLIRAWAMIQELVSPDISLLIAGDVGGSHVFGKNNLPDLPQRTQLVGRIAEEHLAPLLAGADVFVFPSHYEGFGLPPLEAMACGTACITSNVTSLPEVVGDSGITVSPNDDDALATELQKVLNDDDLRASLELKGLARSSLFSWDRTAAATWRVLTQN